MPSDEITDLRDLADQIEQLGRSSRAWSMAYSIVYNATNHIYAMARIMELHRQLKDPRE